MMINSANLAIPLVLTIERLLYFNLLISRIYHENVIRIVEHNLPF